MASHERRELLDKKWAFEESRILKDIKTSANTDNLPFFEDPRSLLREDIGLLCSANCY